MQSKSQEFTVYDRAILRVKRLVPIISVRIRLVDDEGGIVSFH